MRLIHKLFLGLIAVAGILSVTSCSLLSNAPDPEAEAMKVEKRADAILAKMSLKEKITMMAGVKTFYLNPPERVGIPRIMTSDGPVGVCFQRECYGEKAGPTTAYPATIGLASSWNRNLAARFGKAHARDCRARGVHMILAPGVNIYRAPMCGRNFEYFGEDPYLAAQLAVPYIKAVQNEGVMACVKHFVCNNQEWDRYAVSSDVDERTLREIYLPAFKAAVKEGKVWSIMSAYNYINGVHASEYKHTLTDILKNEWGFKGFVISDWWSMHSCVPALNAGLDLEMPDDAHFSYKKIKTALDKGEVTQTRIDDASRRILRPIIALGFLDRPQEDNTIPLLPEEAKKIALQMSREAVVLLKNKNNLLPLDTDKIKTIAVIGPNADPAITGGGGSSKVTPLKAVSVLEGVKSEFKEKAKIVYKQSLSCKPKYLDIYSIEGKYYNNTNFSGKPVVIKKENCLNFNWGKKAPAKGVNSDNFSVRWTAFIKPTKSGFYKIGLSSDDRAVVYLDGRKTLNSVLTYKEKIIKLEADKTYKIRLDYIEGSVGASVNLGFKILEDDFPEAKKIAAEADVVVLCVGFNPDLEIEGRDRPFELPYSQEKLIQQVVNANPNTVVILNAGGNVDMSKWINKTRALLMAWYPGQEGGRAIAEILSGKVNPSAKLPVTFEKQWKDNPCYNSYYDNTDQPKHVKYTEGIFVGYRGYDAKNITPRYPFGFGLSYTTFAYSNLKIDKNKDHVIVSFDITNIGKVKGAEIAQVYVHDVISSVPHPPKELKGFDKIILQPGESKKVNISIPYSSFAFYDVKKGGWNLEPGKFDILIGSSSRDIRLKGNVTVK